jgi:hypothetical protein
MGSGKAVFFNWVTCFPKFLGKEVLQTRVQPNLAMQYTHFDGLNNAIVVFDLRVNLFFKRHANKWTLNYQSILVYQSNTIGELKADDRKV